MVTRVHPQQARFIFVSCDEVTTIDNQSWIFMSIYMMHNFKRFILLNLERLTKGVGDNTLTLIKNDLVSFGVLAYNLVLQENLFALELTISWFSKVLRLQSQNFLKGKHAPFLTIVHCIIHIWTKLLVQILNSLCFTTKIEALLAFVYNYYVHSPKQALE